MNIRDIIKLSLSEKDCEDYLREKGVLKKFDNCIKCGHPGPNRIRRDRYKCYKCKAEWSVRKDSFLNTLYITYSQFILCIKMFDLDLSVARCSEELGLTRKTISKVQDVIYNGLTSCQKHSNRVIKDRTPLYRISYYDNQIKVEQLEQVEQTDNSDRHYYVFGTRRRDSGSVVFYDFQTAKSLKRYEKSLSINGEIGRFWSFAVERLISFNGSSEQSLFGKLSDIAFRYNCIKAERSYFDEILGYFKTSKLA